MVPGPDLYRAFRCAPVHSDALDDVRAAVVDHDPDDGADGVPVADLKLHQPLHERVRAVHPCDWSVYHHRPVATGSR